MLIKTKQFIRKYFRINSKAKFRAKADVKKKGSTFGSIKTLCKGQELTLNAFKIQILQLQPTEEN